MKTKAVLTCDLINSTKLNVGDRLTLNNRVARLVGELSSNNLTEYLVYRGDSIQGLLDDPSDALRHAIYLKAYVKSSKLTESRRSTEADIRISIGLGGIDYKGKNLLDSDGQAFRNSGRTLESMKKKGRTFMLTTPDQKANRKWDVILSILEEVMNQWTISSAEIVWRLIKGMDDKEIQADFDISQPAVSLRKKHAGWDAIQKVLDYYKVEFSKGKDQKKNGNIS